MYIALSGKTGLYLYKSKFKLPKWTSNIKDAKMFSEKHELSQFLISCLGITLAGECKIIKVKKRITYTVEIVEQEA